MAKQKRGKPYLSVVADRRLSSNMEPKPFNGRLTERTVPDPHSSIGARVVVNASLRDDPLGRLFARKQIGEHQFTAGRYIQGLFESVQIGGMQATDPSKEYVSGRGALVDPITDMQRKAAVKLNKARAELGSASFNLMRDVLAGRVFIEQAALARGITGRTAQAALGIRFRDTLDELAVLFGFKGTARAAKRIRDTFSELARDSTNPKLHAAIRLAREAA